MRAADRCTLRFASITLAACATATLVACQPPPPPPPQPAPVVWRVPNERAKQVSQLADHATRLDQQVAALPGRNFDEHRAAMSAVLMTLSESISLAAGNNPSPEVSSHVGVIKHARDVIDTSGITGERVAAVENEAIVASLSALQKLANRPAAPDAALQASLADAQSRLDSLQQTQGPLHELDAAQTLSAVAKSVHILSDDFNGNAPMASTP